MQEATVIFPHQLFSQHPAVVPHRRVYLVEDPLFFSQYAFHKQKLLLHRASMKAYQQRLERANYRVEYVDYGNAAMQSWMAKAAQQGVCRLHVADPADYLITKRLHRAAATHAIRLHWYDSPAFLTTQAEFEGLVANGKRLLMANFYIGQRKRLNVLVEANGEPTGGKWSFDADNRERLPASFPIPAVARLKPTPQVAEAAAYVEKHFAKNPGSPAPFAYATTAEEADLLLTDFLLHRISNFGAYEDAIAAREHVLFHSVLSPALNIGLLTPAEVIDKTLAFHRLKSIPLNSLEGFVRQIIGWREFIRGVYQREGVAQRTLNFFGYHRPVPSSFYTGTTGILPVDQTIKKVLATGYCHHIERLMVLGNFMHLCGFHPTAVYQWFMELFIDAYDWVMVPNVYAMTQYADGGRMTTKPYVSGSNYILKMSDYPKGPWCEVWDALYWCYLYRHQAVFAKNPRMSMMVAVVRKMSAEKMSHYHQLADRFLGTLQ